MITQLTLTNFQKHENLTINFTGGLQVMRGANENGKSSVIRAIAYGFFGSRALPMSLEETVTWGKPVASLKVELKFSHGGRSFTITRKKSGAELVGDGVTASGQAEVTAFVENLFGASASVAQATLLANQSSLQAGLDSSAMPLIEKLANMSLIDELIGKVQTKLPSGNTKGVEAQVQALNLVEPVLDVSSERFELGRLEADLAQVIQQETSARDRLMVSSKAYAELSEAKAQVERVDAKQAQLNSLIAQLKPKLDVYAFEETDLEPLRAGLERQKAHGQLVSAKAKFDALPATARMPYSEFMAKKSELESAVSEARSRIHKLQTERAVAEAAKIKETACGLCGKDLSQVPEVVAKNAQLSTKVAELDAAIASATSEKQLAEIELGKLAVLSMTAQRIDQALPIKFTEVDRSNYPPTVVWVGGEVGAQDTTDYQGAIKAEEAARAAYVVAVQASKFAAARISELETELAALAWPKVPEHVELAAKNFQADKISARDLTNRVADLTSAMSRLQHKIDVETAGHNARLAAYAQSLESRDRLLALLSQYHLNNGIISKLREARPAVAARLWALVLTGVSHYFSLIRGTASTVTRSDKGFLIDGKAVEAFSGSTKDSLGLAIRLMLQKTFLPNVGFMLVDEPGAAFDDNRESDMLAVLASSGLDQVILVTHSDLADTFAANVIQV